MSAAEEHELESWARSVMIHAHNLEDSVKEYLEQAKALGAASCQTGPGGMYNRARINRELKATVIRCLQSLKLEGYGSAKTHALINGPRLVGLPVGYRGG